MIDAESPCFDAVVATAPRPVTAFTLLAFFCPTVVMLPAPVAVEAPARADVTAVATLPRPVTLESLPVPAVHVIVPEPVSEDPAERAEVTLAVIEPRAVVVDALLAAFVPELI
jgi:hypothetical protein